jgi:hypothetical protein
VHTAAVFLTLLAAACSANKNQAQRQRAAAAAEAEAETLDAGLPDACIRGCLPDPGSQPVDCAKIEAGLEFMSVDSAIENFDGNPGDYWGYSYHDGSVPDPAVRDLVPAERCGQPNQVLHIQGGPFQGWGGGLGVSIKDWWRRAGVADPSNPPACQSAGQPFPCESKQLNPGINGRFLDASYWDGISVWARRGPEGQDGVRITLGDKYTDDEQNIDQDVGQPNSDNVDTEQTYCKRARLCSCHSNKPCTPFPLDSENPVYLCYDPVYDPPIVAPGTPNDKDADSEKYTFRGFPSRTVVQFCGQSACDEKFPAGGDDPAFKGKACTPYQFQTGENASYCFDPGKDPNPPESYERCGDHWQVPVHLSTDWQLFLIPFSDMRQQGYGKESRQLHPAEISLFRMTWEAGFIDYYVDDVRFYRVKR